jgi:hypothetical protein
VTFWRCPGMITPEAAAKGQAKGRAAQIAAADRFAADVAPVIAELQARGITSHRDIEAELNKRRVPAPRGGEWQRSTVKNVLARLARQGATAAVIKLPAYDAMCRAIDRAYEVDEVKDIRDQAVAFEAYSRQAKNTQAERLACEIRLRAERRAGELLRDMEKNKGAQGTGSNQHRQVRSADTTAPKLRELGISKQQSSDWQRLSAIPEERFEEALADPAVKPSTAGIIAASNEPKTPPAVACAASALAAVAQEIEQTVRLWRFRRYTIAALPLASRIAHARALLEVLNVTADDLTPIIGGAP